MRNLIIFIAFSFSYLFGIDCNSMSSVSTFNGHYYAKTNTRTTYDTIRVSAVNDKAYLAIPNSAEENEFIKSLVGGNTEAWIGVFDPNHAKNYCFDNVSCFFDDTRFRDVKGQVLTYKNWAAYEPNNFVDYGDMENNIAVVSPLGENWVVMNGNNGQWHDVGNHKISNQNPRNHIAVIEFDTKPICFNESDGVTDTDFSERVCNTQVFDDNIANADKGNTTKCLFDINQKEYCPQGLADATSYWSYIQGDSFKKITSVTDYAQGQYKEYSANVRDFMDGFASTHTSTVTDYQSGSGTQNVGIVTDYQSNSTATANVGNVIDYTKKIAGQTCSKDSNQMYSNCAGSFMTYNNAVTYCSNLNEGGYSDWRLPTLSETTASTSAGIPGCASQGGVWTSTAGGGGHWVWNLTYPRLETNPSANMYVRCAR